MKETKSGARFTLREWLAYPPLCRAERRFRQSQSGFTLIELLVVIAIIAILASMLVPAVSSALETARKSACASNLRQLNLGMRGYSLDNNDRLPLAWSPDNQWAAIIIPYLGEEFDDAMNPDTPVEERIVFFCPVALREHRGDLNSTLSHGSFGMNVFESEGSMASIDFPTRRILLGDGHWISEWWAANITYQTGGANDGVPDVVHGDSVNFGFADGHVQSLTEQEYLPQNDVENLGRWRKL